jgi:hypothetical protein
MNLNLMIQIDRVKYRLRLRSLTPKQPIVIAPFRFNFSMGFCGTRYKDCDIRLWTFRSKEAKMNQSGTNMQKKIVRNLFRFVAKKREQSKNKKKYSFVYCYCRSLLERLLDNPRLLRVQLNSSGMGMGIVGILMI